MTRTRVTVNGEEKSIIDFLIVCEELFSHMVEMKIDEENIYSVESYNKKGGKVVVTLTDHNMIIGKFDIKVNRKEINVRREVFNYKDEEGQKMFRELTSKDTLTKCFEEKNILKASTKWLKELKNIIQRSFKKVRINNSKKETNDVVE